MKVIIYFIVIVQISASTIEWRPLLEIRPPINASKDNRSLIVPTWRKICLRLTTNCSTILIIDNNGKPQTQLTTTEYRDMSPIITPIDPTPNQCGGLRFGMTMPYNHGNIRAKYHVYRHIHTKGCPVEQVRDMRGRQLTVRRINVFNFVVSNEPRSAGYEAYVGIMFRRLKTVAYNGKDFVVPTVCPDAHHSHSELLNISGVLTNETCVNNTLMIGNCVYRDEQVKEVAPDGTPVNEYYFVLVNFKRGIQCNARLKIVYITTIKGHWRTAHIYVRGRNPLGISLSMSPTIYRFRLFSAHCRYYMRTVQRQDDDGNFYTTEFHILNFIYCIYLLLSTSTSCIT